MTVYLLSLLTMKRKVDIISYLTVELFAPPPFIPELHLSPVIAAAARVVGILIVALAPFPSHDAAERFLPCVFPTKLLTDKTIQYNDLNTVHLGYSTCKVPMLLNIDRYVL